MNVAEALIEHYRELGWIVEEHAGACYIPREDNKSRMKAHLVFTDTYLLYTKYNKNGTAKMRRIQYIEPNILDIIETPPNMIEVIGKWLEEQGWKKTPWKDGPAYYKNLNEDTWNIKCPGIALRYNIYLGDEVELTKTQSTGSNYPSFQEYHVCAMAYADPELLDWLESVGKLANGS